MRDGRVGVVDELAGRVVRDRHWPDGLLEKWKSILRKERKFLTDFMLGRLPLVQGSKVGVLSIAPYANTFVDALTQAELQFPDEMAPEELVPIESTWRRFERNVASDVR